MTLTQVLRRWLPHKSERAVYEAIVAAARHPRLYAEYGVPDTVDGRFEMISLHAILVLRALAGDTDPAVDAFRQNLVDELFQDMDRSLREMGAGDLSVGKKVRKMAEVFYGRLQAYGAELDTEGDGLAAALRRNIWPEGDVSRGVEHLAAYLRMADRNTSAQKNRDITAGNVRFGEPE